MRQYPLWRYAAAKLAGEAMSKPGVATATWHNDENFERVVNDLMISAEVRFFVETGTYLGDTVRYIASRYPEATVLTCEIDPIFFGAARTLSRNYRNIGIRRGSSPGFLREALPLINGEAAMFWLDAHWGSNLPLLEECEVVSALERYIILIDDFKVPGHPEFGYDSYGEKEISLEYVSEALGRRCFVPAYERTYHRDALNSAGKRYTVQGYGVFLKGFKSEQFKSFSMLKEISI